MENFNIINLNKFSWPMNVAILGLTFAVFSMIYNDHYIYFGFVTFVFGVLTHVLHLFSNWLFDEKGKYYWAAHLFTLIPTLIWMGLIIKIYFR
jgi:hypothetical protein